MLTLLSAERHKKGHGRLVMPADNARLFPEPPAYNVPLASFAIKSG
jgi:hypothetical protein